MFSDGIYKRLFIPYVVTLLFSAGMAWWMGSQLFSETLEKRLHEQLIHAVETLSRRDFPHTIGIVEQLSHLIRADLSLIGKDGLIDFTTFKGEKGDLQTIVTGLLADHPNLLNSEYRHRVDLKGADYLLVMRPIETRGNRNISYVAALSNLSDIRATSHRMAWWLGLGVISGLLLVAWVGHRTSRSITLPIGELAEMAEKIAAGERQTSVTIHRQDEIGHLAAALNTMAGRLQEYEKTVAEQSRMATLGEMTARIAHEIRNPLTAIKMQLQLLKETSGKEDLAVLQTLLDEVGRLELIVSGTLQHRLPAKPSKTTIDVNLLIDEIIHLTRLQFEHQHIQLEMTPARSLPPLSADRDMLRQILLNLLLNAKDELPDGGKIFLSTGLETGGHSLWIAVDDSGPGIPPDRQVTLFDQPSSDKPGGFGLGLRLCRELVELHGGQIRVEKSKLGGARFFLSLPLQDTTA
ncbi:hypothetical protein DJ030_17000 [bacterium endosymbiont of Escarpia laminata]|nr:MAG: hypothetical protein DJ030_17000 [bacterium endosymbiont of Escarpia laminata]